MFLSYSWGAHRQHVRRIASDIEARTGIRVRWDEELVAGEELHERIGAFLEESDAVIAFVDRGSRTSLEVRDELVRAHERGIPVVPVVSDPDIKDATQLPYYFPRDVCFIRWAPQTIAEAVDEPAWAATLEELGKCLPGIVERAAALRRLQRKIRVLGTILASEAAIQPFVSEMLGDLLDGVTRESREILAHTYEIDLGIEHNYLARAGALFRNASRVFAVSLDQVSTFWISLAARPAARRYLQEQCAYTTRLFVFTTPTALQRYRRVLDAHTTQYGENGTGAVLVCTQEDYRRLVARIGGEEQARRLADQDFGLLWYEGDAPFVLEANLGRTHLKFRPHTNLDTRELAGFLAALKEIPPGGVLAEHGVLKWRRNLDEAPDWAELLARLFPQALAADFVHCVLFKEELSPDSLEALRRELYDLKKTVMTGPGTGVALKEWWFGSREVLAVDDGRFGGQLLTGLHPDFRYLLLMRFETREDLVRFYGLKQHAKTRVAVYERLGDKRLKDLFRMLQDHVGTGRARVLFEAVERCAAEHLIRLDFADASGTEGVLSEQAVTW